MVWFIFECAGAVCGLITPIVVLTVTMGMIRVGIWEGLMKGEWKSFVHLIVFQYHCIMIYWSHVKCMMTEPGVLPKNYNTLAFSKIKPELVETILGVKKEIKKLETEN